MDRHTSGVNCVRWSPVDSHLASAGDDGTVLVWEQSATPAASGLGIDEDDECLEHWKLNSTLRYGFLPSLSQLIILISGSNQEVYDIAWSPDGTLLAAGGMDGCVRVFDLHESTSSEKL